MQRFNAEPSFTDLAVAGLGSPRVTEFFKQCDSLIDFEAIAKPLVELHRARSNKGGAPNGSVTLMLKVLFIQKVFCLSDPAAKQMILGKSGFGDFRV